MEHISKMWPSSMPGLPEPLAQAFLSHTAGSGKRERTHGQLLHAAVQVMTGAGLRAATMQDIAQAAGVTPATVYNHFGTKDTLLEQLAGAVAATLSGVVTDSYADIDDGAERMAIGQRRYVWLASVAPEWAMLFLDLMAAGPVVTAATQHSALADLRLGVRQRKFKVPSEAAALEAIFGIGSHAMRRVALGLAPPRHDIACAALVLRALGMSPDDAHEVASRPLPPLTTQPSASEILQVPQKARQLRGRPARQGA